MNIKILKCWKVSVFWIAQKWRKLENHKKSGEDTFNFQIGNDLYDFFGLFHELWETLYSHLNRLKGNITNYLHWLGARTLFISYRKRTHLPYVRAIFLWIYFFIDCLRFQFLSFFYYTTASGRWITISILLSKTYLKSFKDVSPKQLMWFHELLLSPRLFSALKDNLL